MSDSYISTPEKQRLLIEVIKTATEIRQTGLTLRGLLEKELIDNNVNLLFIRRSYLRELYDYVFRGIPMWSPGIDFAEWLKKNKPEIYQSSASTVRDKDE